MMAPLRIAGIVAAVGLALGRPSAGIDSYHFNPVWLSKTKEPGSSQGGFPTYQGAMPVGNGAFTALAWANVSNGGVGISLGHQDAMSSATELFKLGLIQVALTPNPFLSGPFFNQTLDISTATVLIYAGGTSFADYAVSFRVWVDANADALFVDVSSGDGTTPYSLSASIESVRPSKPYTYSVPFASCTPVGSQPDVFVDPLPGPATLPVPAPLRPDDRFRHASSAERPSRVLVETGALAPGTPVGLLAGSVVQYHRNNASDGLTVEATLGQQGLSSLVATTPDWWQDLQFGFALDSGSSGPALQRSSPTLLSSTAPAAAFSLRATAVAVQTDTPAEWLTDLATAVTAMPANPRPAHEAWWSSFWSRSFVAVNASHWGGIDSEVTPALPRAAAVVEVPSAPRPVASPPVAGAALWLRASSLAGQANGSAVNSWKDESPAGFPVSQANAALQPHFVSDAFGPGAGGVRFDGISSFLSNSESTLPTEESTMFVVLKDGGSTGNGCCSGALFFSGGFVGVSTSSPQTGGVFSDDLPESGAPVVAMIDFPGSNTRGNENIRGSPIIATAVYGPANGTLRIDGCYSASTSSAVGAPSKGVMVGTRNNELERYFLGDIGEIIVYPRVLSADEIAETEAYLAAAWPAVDLKTNATCRQPPDGGITISAMYAVTRYTQAVQSRGTRWPIKFNGMAFVAAMGTNADYRDWGPSNWWQNTRLPYGAMLTAGDYDLMRVILDYLTNAEVLLSQRTQFYWNHTGMWTTETHHLTGAYDQKDYGCSGRDGWPVWLMQSGYLHLDWAGDSGTGEEAIMALDYYSYTLDPSYLHIAFAAGDFLMQHFTNRSEDGNVLIWPAQVLETYWCGYSPSSGFTNCCENDSPTVSAMHAIFEKLLALPDTVTTPAQRAAWTAFSAIMPPLPLTNTSSGPVIAAAAVISSGSHNNEGPELYAIHPHRLFTVGRAVASGTNISLGVRTTMESGFSNENEGWNYGINAYALIGDAASASAQLLQRAMTPPASGYRYPGFAPHMQDFDPSADYFANMNRAVQDMLLQSGEDGFSNTTIVLFPAWPCEWDVTFRLVGPQNTTVDVEYAGGQLISLAVTPPSRASSVRIANCAV